MDYTFVFCLNEIHIFLGRKIAKMFKIFAQMKLTRLQNLWQNSSHGTSENDNKNDYWWYK